MPLLNQFFEGEKEQVNCLLFTFIMDHLLISSKLSVYQRGKRFLIILSDVPYWIVVSKIGLCIISYLTSDHSIDELHLYCYNEFGLHNKVFLDDYIDKLITKLKNDRVFDFKKELTEKASSPNTYQIYTAGINITRDCNLKCLYCYANASVDYDRHRDCLTKRDIENYLDGVKQFAAPDCPIQFTGGEPLLNRELLYYGIKYARKLGFSYITINTNGLLLTQKDIDYFKTYNVDNVTISLDGIKENIHDEIRGKNSFKKAKQALFLLKKNLIHATASITIHKGNYSGLEDFLLFCKDNGIQPFTSPLFPLGRCNCNNLDCVDLYDIFSSIKNLYSSGKLSDSDLDGTFLQTIILPIKDLVHRKYCGTGSSTIFMDSNGDLFPCTNTLGSDYFLCGNIKRERFSDVWNNSSVLNNLRKNVNVDFFDGCEGCDIRYICSGYCRGLTYQVTGKIDSRFIWCESIKKCLIEAMWFLDEHPEIFMYYKDKFNRFDFS